MRTKNQVLLAMCLIAMCFGICNCKKETKEEPHAVETTVSPNNEVKPPIEIIDFVPLHANNQREHELTFFLILEKKHPENTNNDFPKSPETKSAESPCETRKSNAYKWMNDTVLCVAIAIVIALLITTVGLVVSIAYYQKRNQDDAAEPSSPAGSSPDKTGSSSSSDVKSASPSSRGRLLPSHVGLANLKLVTSLKGHKAEDLVKLV